MPEAPTHDSNPFEPMPNQPEPGPPNPQGRPSVDAGAIAAQAARDAIRGSAPRPGEGFREGNPSEVFRGLEDENAQRVQFDEPPQEPSSESPESPESPEFSEPPALPQPTLTVEDLEAHGITLPVGFDEVPDDFRPKFEQLAQAIIDAETSKRDIASEAQQAMAQVQDFANRLSTPAGQRRMLLAMAMAEGGQDVFNQTVQQVQRMQDDPEYAEAVRRQLETEAQLEAVRRRERLLDRREMETKARRIQTRVQRIAHSLGVDPSWAEQEVANQILRNEAQTGTRDITIDQVDQVVGQLAQRVGAKPPTPKPVSKSPQTQTAQQTAPQTQAQGTASTPSQSQPPQQSQQPSTIPSNEHAMDKIRNAVRRSAQNVRGRV